jgi:hypothetical protein
MARQKPSSKLKTTVDGGVFLHRIELKNKDPVRQ